VLYSGCLTARCQTANQHIDVEIVDADAPDESSNISDDEDNFGLETSKLYCRCIATQWTLDLTTGLWSCDCEIGAFDDEEEVL